MKNDEPFFGEQNDQTIHLTARLADTTKISAYGGFQFTKNELENLKNQLDSQIIQFHLQHDPEQPIEVQIKATRLEAISGEEFALFIDFDTDRANYEKFPKLEVGSSPLTGISLSVERPFNNVPILDPAVKISADAANWEAEDLEEIEKEFDGINSVAFYKLYQFSSNPNAYLSILILRDIAIGVLSNAVYGFFKRSKSDSIVIKIKWKSKHGEKQMVLRASDEKSLALALKKLKKAMRAN